MSVFAIIPARGGSKGVPGKNIRKLKDFPLISYSIAAAKLSKQIQRVIVSTDSEEIAGIAKEYGAEAPFLRPAEFAQDHSTDLDFMLHAIEWFKHNENHVCDYWVHLRPTTPLREPALMDEAIDQFIYHPQATSLRSAHRAPESPYKWFQLEDGYFKGIKDSISNDTLNNPRQQFPDVFIPDGYVDVLKTEIIIENHLLHGNKILGYISPFCTEVDTVEDFLFLEHEIETKKSPLLNYLKEMKKG